MSPSVLTLRLFGTLEACCGDVSLAGLQRREGLRLLAYLTLRHGVEIAYGQLAQLFYPSEAPTGEWEGGEFPSTRQAIRTLRQTLGDHAWRLASPRKGCVRFDLDGADVDILAFEQAVQQEDAALWQQALRLYRAPLLADWNEPWIQESRRRCQRSYDRITAKLASLPVSPLEEHPTGQESPEPLLLELEGGAVPLESPFYIERAEDAALKREIERHASTVLIKGARQVGKTSLLARGLHQARQAGNAVIYTDYQMFNDSQFASLESFYLALASAVTLQLELDIVPAEVWNPMLGPNMNFDVFLRRSALQSLSTPLIWGMDEVDRLFACPFGSEVFGLFRSWHNARALNPASPWSRLTLVIAYATEAHLFITDINQSPFNIGTHLAQDDFTPEQFAQLNRCYGSPLQGEEVARLYALVGGQPYLARCSLDVLAQHKLSLAALLAGADTLDIPFGHHLRRLALALSRAPALQEVVRALLNGQPCPTADAFYRLRAAGILAGASSQDARFRCPLYAAYLRSQLL